ncbi:histone methyltransferase set2 [Coemansia sp. RSA 2598]|nr:histone methyltransferase set2 [Coemansia sp. RSA 2598]
MRPSGYATPGGTQYIYGQPRHRYSSWGAQSSGYGYDEGVASSQAANGEAHSEEHSEASGAVGGGGRPDYADRDARSGPKLAPGWKTAYANDGAPYYYHETTKQTQWEPPLAEPVGAEMSESSFASRGYKRRNLGLENSNGNCKIAGDQHHGRFGEASRASSGANHGNYHVSRGSRVPSASSAPAPDEKWSYARRPGKEHSANGSPAAASSGTVTRGYSGAFANDGERERASSSSGVAKARVDDIIERAQRMGMLHSRAGTPSKGAADSAQRTGAVPKSNQLVTPETDGEQVRKPSIPFQSHLAAAAASAATAAAATLSIGTSKPPNSGSESPRDAPLSSSSSSSLLKREKLEKKATAELAAFVVRAMSKYKTKLDHDQFKHEARKITKILMEKERKTPPFDPLKLIEMNQHKKTKIKQFIADYVARLTSRRCDADSPRNAPRSASVSVPKTPPL